MSNQNRQPAGTPVGGQFATAIRPAADPKVTLTDPVRSELRTATSWEDGVDRHAFDRILAPLPERTRDQAWKSVYYLSEQQAKAYEGEDLDPAADKVAQTAYDQAFDEASEHPSSEEAFDEAMAEAFDRNLQEGYDAEMERLVDALHAAAYDGTEFEYRPVRHDLPEVRYSGFQAAAAADAA